MIWLPSIDQVIEMHSILIRRTGGSDGIRDLGLIESAIARASAGYGEYERYPGVEAKAAAIAHGLGSNHGFIDGNKRTGFLLAYIFLRLNGYELNAPEAEAVLAVYSLASGEWIEKDFSRWLEHWSLKDL